MYLRYDPYTRWTGATLQRQRMDFLGQAGAGEILVSRTVRDLVVGSGTGFDDRGSVELRGVPGSWQLLAVDRHGTKAGSPEAELVSTPTPDPRR